MMDILPALAILGACLIAFRIFRQRELHVDRLWIVPLVAMGVLVASYHRLDFSLTGCAFMALGLALGIGLGWARARFTISSIDVPNRRIVTKGGAWMLIAVVVMAAFKFFSRNSVVSQTQDVINLGLLLAVGSVCTQRLQFYRAYRLARNATLGVVSVNG